MYMEQVSFRKILILSFLLISMMILWYGNASAENCFDIDIPATVNSRNIVDNAGFENSTSDDQWVNPDDPAGVTTNQ